MKQSALVAALAAVPLAYAGFAVLGTGHDTAQATTTPAPSVTSARPLLITGVVDAIDSQPIQVPPSSSSPVVLRNYVDDGAVVKKGDVLLRIDTQDAASTQQLQIDSDQAAAMAAKENADLEVRAVEAQRALAEAVAALDKAKVDAALPKSYISGLDFDRNQGERERATRELDVKKKESATASEAVRRNKRDAELAAAQRKLAIDFNIARLGQAQVRALRDGVVVHGYSQWRGERYDEGSSGNPGNTVGYLMGTGAMRVVAWAAEADRTALSVGQAVRLSFDALPGHALDANIDAIASAPAARAEWGNARYFKLDIHLPPHALPLVAGMSVLIERAAAKAPEQASAAGGPLQLEGEIASRGAVPIAPPTIRDVWQYTLDSLAPDGAPVKQGQPIATFTAGAVATQMETRAAALKEKQSTLAKIRLDHAEAARADDLAVAEAASNFERAKRKAMQPKELIRRIDYDKLVIDRVMAEQLAALALAQRDAQARARTAEIAALSSEVARHESAIAVLAKGLEKMTIKAPRDGLMVYRTQFNGEKFAVGAQVWMGLSVAMLADQNRLIVQAKVPEVQAAGVQVGQAARVTVQGANGALAAKVVALGLTYHGKSASQPVIVRDLELEFDTPPKGLKPGAAVQVRLQPLKGKAT